MLLCYNPQIMVDGRPNRVCYTEDSTNWPPIVTSAFEGFGFVVDHFSNNTDAWEDPERGIAAHPDRYDTYVFDNDTGPTSNGGVSMGGSDLIDRVLALPHSSERSIVVIILSSSNPGIFSAERNRELKEKHNVQLCFKLDTFALQAKYARDRHDGKHDGTFEGWLQDTYAIDLREKGGRDRMSELNQDVFAEADRLVRERQREGAEGRPHKER
jgi:hypothetical protein